MYLRMSASEFFTIPGIRVNKDGKEFIFCTKSQTILVFDRQKRDILICTQEVDVRHEELVYIELIRDLILKNEENHGVTVLHAACAYKNDQATLIIGPKGAGKSTMLLELVSNNGYLFMSGDKTFLWAEQGKIMASGWPDYPHLGLGTLSKHPELVSAFHLSDRIAAAEDDLWSTDHKMAFDPKLFKRIIPHASKGVVCSVGQFLYPRLYPSEVCTAMPIHNDKSLMEAHLERIFGTGEPLWNNFIEPGNASELEDMIWRCLDMASEIPAFQITGSNGLQLKL
ncbi:hypothetical protein [Paenibacillus wynnii]|nr:hypothetical protein [Paenibacillus wynnii]